jgi:hypothetical protein
VGRERGWLARVRIAGCLIPYREVVMHDVLIRCICTYIYRYTVGPPRPRLYKIGGSKV